MLVTKVAPGTALRIVGVENNKRGPADIARERRRYVGSIWKSRTADRCWEQLVNQVCCRINRQHSLYNSWLDNIVGNILERGVRFATVAVRVWMGWMAHLVIYLAPILRHTPYDLHLRNGEIGFPSHLRKETNGSSGSSSKRRQTRLRSG